MSDPGPKKRWGLVIYRQRNSRLETRQSTRLYDFRVLGKAYPLGVTSRFNGESETIRGNRLS